MVNFIIIFIGFLFIVYIIGTIKISNTSLFPEQKNSTPFKVGKKFIKEHKPELEEEVKFWYNENQKIIYIYLKGTSGGQGKIGTLHNKKEIEQISNNKRSAKINFITDDTIFLNFYNHE